jgi:hypothetical protein
LKTIESLDRLSTDELARVRQTLFDRYDVGSRGNIVEIGFGVAQRSGKLDPIRPNAICFYVTNKRLPRLKVDRIPSRELVRVKRGHRFVLVSLATDVIEVDRRAAQLTGRGVRHVTDDTHARAGAILAWRFNSSGRFAWGVLTVGHLFWDRDAVPESTNDVRIRANGNRQIKGRLMLRSLPESGVDAAIVLVARTALVEGGLMRASTSVGGKSVRSVEKLSGDTMKLGTTLPGSRPIGFQVLRYLPEFSLIRSLGPIQHALDVRSNAPGTFRTGTSGSPWIIARQAACQQFAGWQSEHSSQNYIGGIGQSLQTILTWCRDELATLYRRRTEQTELRLIREL